MTTPNNKQVGERMQPSSGKWNAANRDDGMFVEGHPDFNDGHAICECFGPDAVANARLIAAAPELLEACKKIIAAYTAGKIQYSPVSESNALLAFICDAANKAEGRLP